MDSSILKLCQRLSWVLIALFVFFVVWCFFGEIDTVVTAQGRLIPASFVQVAQPAEAGVVRELLIHDGQGVHKGEVLVRMDAVYVDTDLLASKEESQRLSLQMARIEAELAGTAFAPPVGAPSNLVTASLSEFTARKQALAAALAEATAAKDKTLNELASSQENLTKLNRTLTSYQSEELSFRKLKAEGFYSETAYQEKNRQRIEKEQDLLIIRKNVDALKAGAQQATSGLVRVRAEYVKNLEQERAQVLAQMSKLTSEIGKSEHRAGLYELKAPVSGVIQGLSVHTAGAVVQAGATIANIIPNDAPLVAEVWLRNEDAGFVYEGQSANVKISTFPFQKYGLVPGKVQHVSADAEIPESMRNSGQQALFFKTRVALSSHSLTRNAERFNLGPGMQVTADFSLGNRTLLEYLTSPLIKTVREAARER